MKLLWLDFRRKIHSALTQSTCLLLRLKLKKKDHVIRSHGCPGYTEIYNSNFLTEYGTGRMRISPPSTKCHHEKFVTLIEYGLTWCVGMGNQFNNWNTYIIRGKLNQLNQRRSFHLRHLYGISTHPLSTVRTIDSNLGTRYVECRDNTSWEHETGGGE